MAISFISIKVDGVAFFGFVTQTSADSAAKDFAFIFNPGALTCSFPAERPPVHSLPYSLIGTVGI